MGGRHRRGLIGTCALVSLAVGVLARPVGASSPLLPSGVQVGVMLDRDAKDQFGPADFTTYSNWVATQKGTQPVSVVDLGEQNTGRCDPGTTGSCDLAKWGPLLSTGNVRVAMQINMLPLCPGADPADPTKATPWPTFSEPKTTTGTNPGECPKQKPSPLDLHIIHDNLHSAVANWGNGTVADFEPWYKNLAINLVRLGMANNYLKIAPEASGDWYAWQYGPNVADWVTYYKDIATVMDNVNYNGVNANFTFVWVTEFDASTTDVTGNTIVPPKDSWPLGTFPSLDSPKTPYASTIGFDFGDLSPVYKSSCFVQTDGTLHVPGLADWQSAWNNDYNTGNTPASHFGLQYWLLFAANQKRVGTTFAFTQWHLNACDPANGIVGGGDNTYLIHQISNFITAQANTTNSVTFADYYDVGDAQLSPDPDATPMNQFPNAACKYLYHFYGAPC